MKAGEEIAWEQFPLEGSYARTEVSDAGEMKVSSDDEKLRVAGEDFKAVFDRRTGWLESYEFDSQTLIEGPMKLSLRRPGTNNEMGAKLSKELAVWRTAEDRMTLLKFRSNHMSGNGKSLLKIDAEYSIPARGSKARFSYEVRPDGSILVSASVSPAAGLPPLQKVGMQFRVPAELDEREWFGEGPYETYSDRREGAWEAVFKAKISEAFFPYIEPQESSNASGARYAKISGDDADAALLIEAAGPKNFEFSAYPCLPEDIEQASHHHQIPKRDFNVISVSAASAGVGGKNSWSKSGLPEKPHTVESGKTYEFSFLIKGLED